MRTVVVRDVQLAVVDRGQGRTVLFVHGFPLDHSMWTAQLDALAEDYRVLVPDLRGFGQSAVTAGTVTMADFADDLAGLLDALDEKTPIVLCGLSMGGYIALQFWKRYPRRLSGLVLCDTRAAADSPEVAASRHELVQRVLGSEGAAAVWELMRSRLFAPSAHEQQPALVKAIREVVLRTKPEGIAAALRGMAARPDMRGELPNIGCPTLVLCGQHDAISPVAEMRNIAAAIPAARFVEIAAAGHMAPCEQPAPVNAALRAFLERVFRPTKERES
jgi:pimeloyl-ACP methyl ester carboxylesterase